ncbi:dipeptidase [Wansuia hejianensis]|uniref:Membrane dipeptidase n=1 Tax=Wansuia hejianensis TaxID=2763667 RepID=A0A926F4A4_9FIRM|nr:dipeptidase [Wansuia hejianensis]MBC8591624.1 membrane dipeptidase [Wansuia hejianensis]
MNKDKVQLLILIFLICIIIIIYITQFKGDDYKMDLQESKSILKKNINPIIVDGHNDTMMKVIDNKTWLPKVNIGRSTDNHIDILKLKKGGLNVPFFAAFTHGYYENTTKSISRTLATINALYWTEKNNPDTFKITTSIKDILAATKDNKIAAVPTIEGAYSLDKYNGIELLNQYYDLGIRVLSLTWNYSNELGEGANRIYGDPLKTESKGGLTNLGRQVIQEMNKIGMVLDVSHLAESTFWDVISTTDAPIIASHSGVYALKEHPRNLNDKQLFALKENGGVVAVVLCSEFLTNNEQAYISDFVDHIDYIVKLIGVDHVGIGSDFDGSRIPIDLKDSSQIYKITQELLRREYGEKDIEKILGKNLLRVLEQVENRKKPRKINHNIEIIPEYKMGQIIKNRTPILKSRIKGEISDIDVEKSRIVLDGIPYRLDYDYELSTVYYKVKKPLEERFHVVSFEIYNNTGMVKKDTIIFYIQDKNNSAE